MKTVFIAHPIAGDIEGNAKLVLKICEEIHRGDEQIIPVAPYLVSLQYLNDELIEDRQLGIEANSECFRRKYIDELWLYGDHISTGMREEILLAQKVGIRVIPQTPETKKDFEQML